MERLVFNPGLGGFEFGITGFCKDISAAQVPREGNFLSDISDGTNELWCPIGILEKSSVGCDGSDFPARFDDPILFPERAAVFDGIGKRNQCATCILWVEGLFPLGGRYGTTLRRDTKNLAYTIIPEEFSSFEVGFIDADFRNA